MERKQPRCREQTFHALCISMNKRQDEVSIRTVDLKEMVECHVRSGGTVPRELLMGRGRQRTLVRREALLVFVDKHGQRCGHQGEGTWRQPNPGTWKWEIFRC